MSKLSQLVFFLLVLCLTAFLAVQARPTEIGVTDFVQYWTSVMLLFSGESVYDPAVVEQFQSGLPIEEYPILMWNPPFILPLFFWCRGFSLGVAASLWMVISVSLIVLALYLLGRVFRVRTPTREPYLLVYVFTLYPIALMIFYGQISSLLLVSLVGFLYFAGKDETETGSYRGGLLLGLGLVKPHLLWLMYGLLGVESMRKRDFRAVFGIVTTISILAMIVLLVSPQTYWSYFTSWREAPIYWKTPTAGSWLQEFTGVHTMMVRVLPTAVGALVFAVVYYLRKEEVKLRTYIWLIPFSLVLSPYGWVYDQLLLLPCFFLLLEKRMKSGMVFLIAANLLMATFSDGVGQEWMVWYPLAFILAGISQKIS